MISIDAISLLDLIRKLINRKSETDEKFFYNFIQPTWETFNAIHENYKESFKEYINLLSRADIPIYDILQKIRFDSIFTIDLRAQIDSYFHIFEVLEYDQLIELYYLEITRYFYREKALYISSDEKRVKLIYESQVNNAPRYEAIIFLNRSGDDVCRQDAIDVFEIILKHLQEGYGSVAKTYQKLKSKLLT